MIDSPLGDKTTLEVGYNSANPLPFDTGYSKGSSANRGEAGRSRDALLKFSMGELDTNTLSSAVLKLYVASASTMRSNITSGGVRAVNFAAFEVSSDWSANTASWNNSPEAGKLAAVSQAVTGDKSALGSAG